MLASATSSTDVLFADNAVCEKEKRFLVTFCRLAKSYPLLGAEALALRVQSRARAKALDSRLRGNDEQEKGKGWIPASAGMTSQKQRRWIPAFAGMTSRPKAGFQLSRE